MPHDLVTLRQDIVEKSGHGSHDMVVLTKHEAPANDDGSVAFDPYKEKDLEIAGTMMRWLQRHFPGYPWCTVADSKQGIVKFNIPILMGITDWWVINLRTHDVITGMHMGAGQILERYRLPRKRFVLAPFLEAREQHSKLVVPRRAIPE